MCPPAEKTPANVLRVHRKLTRIFEAGQPAGRASSRVTALYQEKHGTTRLTPLTRRVVRQCSRIAASYKREWLEQVLGRAGAGGGLNSLLR